MRHDPALDLDGGPKESDLLVPDSEKALFSGLAAELRLRGRPAAEVPLIKECYEQILEQQPALSATVRVRFTIEGDPELGGVISSSEIMGADGLGWAGDPYSAAEKEATRAWLLGRE